MQRMSALWLVIGSLGLLGGLAGGVASAQSPLREQPLAPGIAMLSGRGGNIAVVHGADGTLLVDDQYAPATPEIQAAVARLGGGAVRFVLNTHWHGDHTGGNENLAKAGALIVAHENVRRRMGAEQWNPLRQAATPASPPAALPLVSFDEGIRFHLNGYQIDAIHVDPAHTDGDAIVVFREANLLHLGDVYFNGLYPYIDTSSGGSIDGMLAAVDRALALCDEKTRIIPGHGPLSSPEELRGYARMLTEVRANVKAGIDAGRSADEVVASRPTAAWDARWGGGFLSPEAFTRIVYASLSGKR